LHIELNEQAPISVALSNDWASPKVVLYHMPGFQTGKSGFSPA